MTAGDEKKEALLKLLEGGPVLVHLDPRREGVVVPPHLRSQPHLALRLDYAFNLPVFEIDDEGVVAALSFSGQRSSCTLPWESIFMMNADGAEEALVWHLDVPPELARAAAAAGRAEGLEEAQREEGGAEARGEGDEEAEERKPRRPHLRLVK